MTRQEHLLIILSEECAEVIKEVSKALRFGLKDHAPNENEIINNATKISDEYYHIVAVMSMLRNEGCLKRTNIKSTLQLIEAKKVKVEYYLKYSKKCGTLN